jgi:hypothetical protein
MGGGVDDTTLVTDLVYGGTFVLGVLMLSIGMALLIAMMLLAGAAGAFVSLARRARPCLLRAERVIPVEAAAPPGQGNAEVLAKANAILAALRAAREELAAIADLEETAAEAGAADVRKTEGRPAGVKAIAQNASAPSPPLSAPVPSSAPSARPRPGLGFRGLLFPFGSRPLSEQHPCPSAHGRPEDGTDRGPLDAAERVELLEDPPGAMAGSSG